MTTAIAKPINIPAADGVPVLGSALRMLKNPLQFLIEQRQKHGDVFRIKAGPRSMVVISGVDANRFMNEDGKACLHSRGFWGKLTDAWDCPHMLTALDGEAHIQDRRVLKSTMSKKIADERQAQLIQIVHSTVADYLQDSSIVSARDLTRSLTNNELYYLLTNEFPSVDRRTAYSMAEYQRITFNVLQLGKWPRLMFLTPHYLYHRRRSMKFIRGLIARYSESPPDSGWFKVVLELQQQPGRTDGDLLANFFAPFWAGLDTLGSSLTFLFRELLDQPELLHAATTEIDAASEANDGELPDPDALRKLPLLFGMCMEILRLYPVAFGNPRTAAKDFEYKGFPILEGEDLMVFTTATHFDPQYFPEPMRFDTTRYLDDKAQHRQRFAFNPYGRGPHICLGASMAESMMLTTVATLLRNYTLTDDGAGKRYEMIFDPSPTLPAAFKIKLQRRR